MEQTHQTGSRPGSNVHRGGNTSTGIDQPPQGLLQNVRLNQGNQPITSFLVEPSGWASLVPMGVINGAHVVYVLLSGVSDGTAYGSTQSITNTPENIATEPRGAAVNQGQARPSIAPASVSPSRNHDEFKKVKTEESDRDREWNKWLASPERRQLDEKNRAAFQRHQWLEKWPNPQTSEAQVEEIYTKIEKNLSALKTGSITIDGMQFVLTDRCANGLDPDFKTEWYREWCAFKHDNGTYHLMTVGYADGCIYPFEHPTRNDKVRASDFIRGQALLDLLQKIPASEV